MKTFSSQGRPITCIIASKPAPGVWAGSSPIPVANPLQVIVRASELQLKGHPLWLER